VIGNIRRFEPFGEAPIRVIDDAASGSRRSPATSTRPCAGDLPRHGPRPPLDERLSTLQRQGKVSFVASAAGHEATRSAPPMRSRRGATGSSRTTATSPLALALGWPLAEALAQQMASRLDPARGRQMPAHPGSAALRLFTAASRSPATCPRRSGSAIAQKLAGRGDVTLCSFGDGATSEGDWHAALNLAGAQGAPAVFLCQNNGYAISVAFRHQSGSADVATKAHAYGMPGYRVDGMDPLAATTSRGRRWSAAREGSGRR
jgi:2-oxoisovalerate dehydrogenase E1 component alpha subunit